MGMQAATRRAWRRRSMIAGTGRVAAPVGARARAGLLVIVGARTGIEYVCMHPARRARRLAIASLASPAHGLVVLVRPLEHEKHQDGTERAAYDGRRDVSAQHTADREDRAEHRADQCHVRTGHRGQDATSGRSAPSWRRPWTRDTAGLHKRRQLTRLRTAVPSRLSLGCVWARDPDTLRRYRRRVS